MDLRFHAPLIHLFHTGEFSERVQRYIARIENTLALRKQAVLCEIQYIWLGCKSVVRSDYHGGALPLRQVEIIRLDVFSLYVAMGVFNYNSLSLFFSDNI